MQFRKCVRPSQLGVENPTVALVRQKNELQSKYIVDRDVKKISLAASEHQALEIKERSRGLLCKQLRMMVI